MKKLINALKQMNNKVYIGGGEFEKLNCKFNSPASEDTLKKFETCTNCILPNDYKEFLKNSNGLLFFESADFIFYDINEIIQFKKSNNFKEEIYPIGYILEDNIVINSKEIVTGKYLYVGDAFSGDEYYSLECDFKTFFDRLIVSNINNFWRWNYGREYYNFMK